MLKRVIGFTNAQLSNILCILCNVEDATFSQLFGYIKYANRLMDVQKDQKGTGLVISNLLDNSILEKFIDLNSRIDYILYGKELEKSSDLPSFVYSSGIKAL